MGYGLYSMTNGWIYIANGLGGEGMAPLPAVGSGSKDPIVMLAAFYVNAGPGGVGGSIPSAIQIAGGTVITTQKLSLKLWPR